jgi:hypothetical protein
MAIVGMVFAAINDSRRQKEYGLVAIVEPQHETLAARPYRREEGNAVPR